MQSIRYVFCMEIRFYLYQVTFILCGINFRKSSAFNNISFVLKRAQTMTNNATPLFTPLHNITPLQNSTLTITQCLLKPLNISKHPENFAKTANIWTIFQLQNKWGVPENHKTNQQDPTHNDDSYENLSMGFCTIATRIQTRQPFFKP